MLLTHIRTSRVDAVRRKAAARRAAFTLLEVLIVVAILVILGGAASIAYFRYLEDAKVGRAKNDMRVIEQAYKKVYGENGGQWPNSIQQIAPQLESGNAGILDPWGQPYQVSIQTRAQEDGQSMEYPQVMCQPPGGKPPIYYPPPRQ